MPARTGVEGMRRGPWESVVGWIGRAPIEWELEVSRQLEEFGGGIAGRMGIGYISGHGREMIFKVVVGEEVVRADWRVMVTVRGWRVVIKLAVQGT